MTFFIESLGVGIAISLIFAVVLGFISFMRYLRYKETIELARQGLLSPQAERNRSSNGRSNRRMRSGIIVASIGVALTLGLSTIGFEENYFFGPWLLGGLIPLAVGIGLYVTGKMSLSDDAPPAGPHRRPPEFDASHFDSDDIDAIPPHKRDKVFEDIHLK